MSIVAASLFEDTNRRRRTANFRWPEWIALGSYAALVTCVAGAHEPFADEAQAWQIAIHNSVWNLLAHCLRYEGSPSLWYVLLRTLHALHIVYADINYASAAIAICAAAVLIFRAPFSLLFRLTLPFTFFLAYQYAVVARSYVLAPLLLFLIAATWNRRSAITTALLLGCLANVAGHAFFISIGFAAVCIYEIGTGRRIGSKREMELAAIVLVVFYAIAILTVWPTPSGRPSAPVGAHISWSALLLEIAEGGLIHVLLAVSSWPLLAIVCGGAFLLAFCDRRRFVYLAPLAALVLFCGYTSELHHAGLAIPAGIAVCWVVRERGFAVSKAYLALACAWMLFQVCWTAKAAIYDVRYAYSPDLATAAYLRPYVEKGGLLAASYLNDPSTDAFWSVGLEPYFAQPILLDQSLPYWLPVRSYHTEARFLQGVSTRPGVVLLEYHSWSPYDRARDLHGEHVALLEREGYHESRTFCGSQMAGWSAMVTVCDVVFEQTH